MALSSELTDSIRTVLHVAAHFERLKEQADVLLNEFDTSARGFFTPTEDEPPEMTFLEKPGHVIATGAALSIGVMVFGLVLVKKRGVSVRALMAVLLVMGIGTGALAKYASHKREAYNKRLSERIKRDRADDQQQIAKPGKTVDDPGQGGTTPTIDPPEIDLPDFD